MPKRKEAQTEEEAPKAKESPQKKDTPKKTKKGEDDNNNTKKKSATKAEEKEEKPQKLTPEQFMKEAKPIKISIECGGEETVFTANPNTFKSGSFGWGVAGKVLKLTVGGQEMSAQVSINLPIRGSKPSKKNDQQEEEESEDE